MLNMEDTTMNNTPTLGREETATFGEILAAIRFVLDYLWDDELADYRACSPQKRRGHIFEVLRKLDHWLAVFEGRRAKAGTQR
jgi:hypothetical protein